MSSLMSASSQTEGEARSLARKTKMRLIWLLTVVAGITVANLYYNQPLLASIAQSFAISAGQVGFLGTLTQLGYALGLLFLVPLGDSRERRGLIVTLLVLEALALLATALAPGVGWMAVSSLAVGFFTVIPQIIVPFAASLAEEEQRGRVVGTVLSGILSGVLLARFVSGLVGAQLGWRAMYGGAAGLMVLLALALWRILPRQAASAGLPYPRLLASLVSLLKTEPALRPVCLFGALAFAAFNVFWVTLAFFLQTPPYHAGSAVAGLFGLVGVIGATIAPRVGRLADRTRRPRLTIGLGLFLVLLAFALFWLLRFELWGLIVGVILLDLGVQMNLTSCQAIVQSLNATARSRLNTIFMTAYFIGGALGSALGSSGWSAGRWPAVCTSGALLIVLALLIFLLSAKNRRRQAKLART